MNRLITKIITIRGVSKTVDQLKKNSNIKVTVECKHGQREVRWYRRHQQCRKCVSEAGLYNPTKKGRQITWGDNISKAKKGIKATKEHKKALTRPPPPPLPPPGRAQAAPRAPHAALRPRPRRSFQ